MTFFKDDSSYKGWIESNPDGYVLNTFNPPRASYLVLHRAFCRTINPIFRPDVQNWTLEYGKVCGSTVSALQTWVSLEFGAEAEIHWCGHCLCDKQ